MAFEFERLEIPDVILITPKAFSDEMGFFMESHKESEFKANGINFEFKQDNHSKSSKNVLRGLHYQLEPYAQGKIVRVITGKIFDVAVDIRKGSPTFGKWVSAELSEVTRKCFGFRQDLRMAFYHLKTTQMYYTNLQMNTIRKANEAYRGMTPK